MANIWKNYRLPILMLFGMLLGTLLGAYLEGNEAGMTFLKDWVKPIGQVFLNLLFTVLVPLVFASVASAVANLHQDQPLGKLLARMMVVFTTTGFLASIIMLFCTYLFPPGGVLKGLSDYTATESESLGQTLVKALTVSDFGELFSKKNMLPLIIFSVLTGMATQKLGDKAAHFKNWLLNLNEIMMQFVAYIMYIAPLGLFAWFAYLRGTFGSALMESLGRSVGLFFVVAFAYFFIMFSLYVWWAARGAGLKKFWQNIGPASLVAFGTGSSMATIPANLDAARKIGVPRYIRELVIPMGATIHMDGSCLSAVSKIALLAGLYGYELHTPMGWITCIGVSILSGTVMSGIPGGGKIGELLILSLYGFPTEGLILIAALGDLVDAPATALNAIGDNVASMMVARLEQGSDWMPEGIDNE